MSDAKFGRLFTEVDVLSLIQGAFEMGVVAGRSNMHLSAEELQANYPSILGVLARRRGALTFPADEPLFLGSDEFNDGAGYVRGPDHYRDLVRLQFAFADWQEAHPDRVKVPD